MLRYFAGVGSALLLAIAGLFAWQGLAQGEDERLPPAPVAAKTSGPEAPPTPPSADERTKEQRRFDRADRDNDGRITLDELYHPRRRAFERLDANRDGRLAFEEWAVSTSEKFAGANANRDQFLTRAEYATTAPRRRTPEPSARCDC